MVGFETGEVVDIVVNSLTYPLRGTVVRTISYHSDADIAIYRVLLEDGRTANVPEMQLTKVGRLQNELGKWETIANIWEPQKDKD